MTEQYADIIVDISHSELDKVFQYIIPEELAGKLEPGNVVEIPFGRGNRMIRGYVLRLADQPSYEKGKMKFVSRLVTDLVGGDTKLVALALWMRDFYGSTTVQALRTVLPLREKAAPKEKKKIVLCLSREEALEVLAGLRKKNQKARARLLEALIDQPVLPWEIAGGALKITMPVVRAMEEKGILEFESEHVYRTPQLIRGLLLQEQEDGAVFLHGGNHTEQESVLPAGGQRADGEISRPALSPGGGRCSGRDDAGCRELHGDRKSEDSRAKQQILTLNEEQRLAVDEICRNWQAEPSGKYLIHGVTGSGKTEVYMELIAYALAQGEQAILLIPEISLTYQNVMRFYKRFGDRISILHSRLTPNERYDQFERARNGDIDIMIGPRSALFTPFPKLGIIIIDEEHEPSYRSESVPRYHARETAARRAALEGAKLVLGSATPSLEAYYRAQQGDYHLIRLSSRASGGCLPTVCTADLREELRAGNRSILSRLLREKMERCLADHQQMMLFLNRRGYSGSVVCRACGHVIKCPHCDVSLSLHRNGQMICHYCGYRRESVRECPSCGSRYIGGFGIGTQQIEEIVAEAFPQARILRMDADTTRGKDGHAAILHAFSKKEADILIGTQMIVKGHDFPDVTLVGILAADLSLNVSDFRAAERTYQLLTQAAGRAGRGMLPGEVVIQTYAPEHYAVVCAAAQEYEPFYQKEIAYRRMSGYPPVGGMLAIHCSCADREKLETAVSYLGEFARRASARYQTTILGPSDEPVARINDVYRKVIYAKQADERKLTAFKNKLEQYIEMNEGYQNILIQFEMN